MRLKINLLNKLIVSAILFCVAFFSDAKTALIVVAHGSPFQKWNGPTLMLEARLDSMDIPGIDYVRVALMEFSQPDVYSIFADCERENIDSALVFPLSSHLAAIPRMICQTYLDLNTIQKSGKSWKRRGQGW